MSEDQAAFNKYHARYSNQLYVQLKLEMYRERFGVYSLRAFYLDTSHEVAADMNTITDAALQICGHTFYKDATTRAALVAATYSSQVIDLIDQYLCQFM